MTSFVDLIKETGADIRRKVRSLVSGVDEYIDDRLKSPFIWSFVVSWLVINWEMPAKIMFENDSVNVVWLSNYIESLTVEDYSYPLFISIFYVLIFRPLASLLGGVGKWMMGFSQKANDHIMRRRSIPYSDLAREKRLVKALRETAQREYVELNDLQKKYNELDEIYNSYKSDSEGNIVEIEKLTNELSSRESYINGIEEQLKNSRELIDSIIGDFTSLFDDSGRLIASDELINRIKERIEIIKRFDSMRSDKDNTKPSTIDLLTDSKAEGSESIESSYPSADAYIIEKRVLLSIIESEWFSMVDVRKDLGITPAEFERAIRSLVGSGWVEKRNGRYFHTSEGKERVQEIILLKDPAIRELNDEYVEETRERIKEILSEGGIELGKLKLRLKIYWNLVGLLDQMKIDGEIDQTKSIYRLKVD